ncbi:hypothetical protein EGW08_011940 [Elysia chlorotica]|uniref:Uncharacterized protein n=1 Tax=Elysia chlorotica TaxID=188477 RepID=A0A3S1HIT5_ELYCH|nr:hypothetical protein EGW08_011940 [Elysia chlorotica]
MQLGLNLSHLMVTIGSLIVQFWYIFNLKTFSYICNFKYLLEFFFFFAKAFSEFSYFSLFPFPFLVMLCECKVLDSKLEYHVYVVASQGNSIVPLNSNPQTLFCGVFLFCFKAAGIVTYTMLKKCCVN